jgi:hypothetical protein
MIVFDLKCAKEHVFEVWFRDTRTFERQARKGEVVCPVCGDTTVEKALMAPNISSSRKKEAAAETIRAVKAMRALAEIKGHVEQNFDYVGPGFAEEARKIHHGETEKRDIYGEASEQDARELTDEGIEFGRIPWLPRADG